MDARKKTKPLVTDIKIIPSDREIFRYYFKQKKTHHSINTEYFMAKNVTKKCPKNLVPYIVYAGRPSFNAINNIRPQIIN